LENIFLVELTILLVFLTLVLWLYLFLAIKCQIFDKPNQRSSHSSITIRGGGIIFPISIILWFFLCKSSLSFLTIAIIIISVIGFWDDIKNANISIRLAAQMISFLFVWYQLFGNTNWSLWIIVVAFVSIGVINAVNFMDGINGMTGFYALSFFVPLNLKYVSEANDTPLSIFLVLAILAFGFFNFRKKAICFLGDVGSLSIGLIFVFYILALIYGFNPLNIHEVSIGEFNISYLLLLSLYGIDVILTLFQRLFLGHKLFTPHRMHLYQLFVNDYNMPHLLVSFIYAFLQLLINIWVLWFDPTHLQSLFLIILLCIIYVFLKFHLSKKK
jgi:UDP-GlcNAc:undecaprenyl-phosphate GlcNAc-1-phosphate transferase